MVRILVVGPGAIGVQLAVRLQEAGHDVTVGARDVASARRLPPRLTATDPDGTRHQADVKIVGRPSGVAADLLLLTPKCDDAADALRTWRQALDGPGTVVAFQNGIMGDTLAPLAGDRFLECTVAFPATLLGPGSSEMTAPGDLIVGPWPDLRMAGTVDADAVARVLADAFATRIHNNMLGVKWTKLLINSAITGLGVVTGQSLGHLLSDRRARAAFLHIITEGYAAGLAADVRFEKVGGLHPRWVAISRPSRWRIASRHGLLRLLGRKYRRQRSSSLQSLERGRRTEVHHLNGRIVAEARKRGLEAPVNAAVVALAAEVEGGATPSVEHLGRLPLQFL